VRKAQTAVDQAQVEYENWKTMVEKKIAGSQLEYDRARTLLEARKVDLDIAKLQRLQAGITLRVREAQLERVMIRAPFDGIVDNVLVEAGEVKRDTDPVLKIVATDPLSMDVNTPTDQAFTLSLKKGDKAWVVLDVPGEPAVYVGKIVEVGAEADFGGRSLRIRVELPNPAELPAGIQAWVRFTQPEGEWAKRIAPPKRAAGGQTAGVLAGTAAEQAKK
jgi:multidrug efflux pump subunit AcrA (membrane-fusion protein)